MLATYGLASLGGALAVGAVGAPEPSLFLYPAHYCLANCALAMLISYRRKVLAGKRRS